MRQKHAVFGVILAMAVLETPSSRKCRISSSLPSSRETPSEPFGRPELAARGPGLGEALAGALGGSAGPARSPAPGGRLGGTRGLEAEPLECISARMLSVPWIDHLDTEGAVAAALREVLAPVPGEGFRDRYVDLPFDLSEALFVATANSLGPVPAVLREGMAVVGVPGYTETEKRDIAVGLCWTAAGGDVLVVEASRMPGSGGLALTGRLGRRCGSRRTSPCTGRSSTGETPGS